MSDGSCPVCGQSYGHKTTEEKGKEKTYRDDVAVCKTEWGPGREREVMVHYDRFARYISRVEAKEREESGGFWSMFR